MSKDELIRQKYVEKEREGGKRERTINACKGRAVLISPGIKRLIPQVMKRTDCIVADDSIVCAMYIKERIPFQQWWIDRGLSFLKYFYKMYICIDGNVSSSCILSKQRFLTIRHICITHFKRVARNHCTVLLVSDYVWSVSNTEILAIYKSIESVPYPAWASCRLDNVDLYLIQKC
jgi:hypothetical protein